MTTGVLPALRLAEKFSETARVKGTLVRAHLDWAATRVPNLAPHVQGPLSSEIQAVLTGSFLMTDWIRLEVSVAVDRAIAAAVGGDSQATFRELGRQSAVVNLTGVYRSYVVGEPHRFFESMSRLHPRFISFGQSSYEPKGERAGTIRLSGMAAFSPVMCASGAGYYRGALEMLKVPGPIRVVESACACAGGPACAFDLSW